MKKYILALFVLICCCTVKAHDYASYVNPLMGTMSDFSLSSGNTYPAIARPFGMNFWTPQTGKNGDGWQYTYTAHTLRGFKQTHQPSPWMNDYATFSLMPMTGQPIADEEKRASHFSHKSEVALPYYYRVYLADYDVTTELTPTERACIFRFTFPKAMSYVCIDAFGHGGKVEVNPSKRMVSGYTRRNSGGVPDDFKQYFVILFDKDFEYSDPLDSMAIVGFRTMRGEQIHARVASSYISPEQALYNLQHELRNDSFDDVKAQGRDVWNSLLGRIDILAGKEENADVAECSAYGQGENANATCFYSCLYRSLLFPMSYWEERMGDNRPVHRSPHNGELCDGYLYTGTGFWDTFRALFPLLNLVYPDYSERMMEGFLNVYRESGFLPEWSSPGHRGCMVGNNSAAVMADAFSKGIRVSDDQLLMEALLHGKNAVHPKESSTGRLGYDYYNRLGYVPYNVGINESAARTLEYAYDDWCILQIARGLNAATVAKGKKRNAMPVDAKTIRVLEQQALNYRNLFDTESNLMRGRNDDGSFQSPFSPLKWGDAFTEGNAWHYTWSVFHDPAGLASLMGGRSAMTVMLDSVFAVPPSYDDSYYGFPIHEIVEMTVMNTGNYAHGNQPIQHMLYLYDWTGQPWRAQSRIRDIMARFYAATPDGYCGDEDNGQTSAWYVFSALGFYPVCPGSGEYAIGSPLFRNAIVHFPAYGNHHATRLIIKAPENSAENIYVNHIDFHGNYTHNYLRHDDIRSGGTLHFHMTDVPNTNRGTEPDDFPYSFSTSKTTECNLKQ